MAGKAKNICLIGPTGAGKSALMASLVHAVERRLHGFDPELTFTIAGWAPEQNNAADPLDEFAAGLRPGKQKELELLFLGQGDRLPPQAATGPSQQSSAGEGNPSAPAPPDGQAGFPSTRLETRVYRFQIDSVPCNVVDTGGELLSMAASNVPYPDLRAAKQQDDQLLKPFDEFINELRQCDCLVLTLPLLDFTEALWAPRMTMVLDSLMGLSKPPQLEQIIVAWTHYDVLLAPFGPFAATLACHPERGRAAILLALTKYTQINNLLNKLQQKLKPATGGKFPIHHIPVSSHGFISKNGASFTHLNGYFGQYLDTQKSFRHETIRDFWRPFLSADPILAAAFGIGDHPFFYLHPIDKPQDRESAGPSLGFWSSLKAFWARLSGPSTTQEPDPRAARPGR